MPESTTAPRSSTERCTSTTEIAEASAAAISIQLPDGSVDHVYIPTPKQIAFHTSDARNLLAHGGRGSGKSKMLRWDAFGRCLSFPGFRALVLRRTMPELRQSHINDLGPELVRLNAGSPKNDPLAWFTQLTSTVNFSNGSHTQFGHVENDGDVLRYLSAQYDAIYFDELTTFTLEMFLKISGSARSTVESGRTAIVRGATNPIGPGASWVRDWFIDHSVDPEEVESYQPEDYEDLPIQLSDNPHQDTPEYRRKLAQNDARTVAAWLHGEWVDDDQLFKLTPEHILDGFDTCTPDDRLFRSIAVGMGSIYCLWLVIRGSSVLVVRESRWLRAPLDTVAAEILRITGDIQPTKGYGSKPKVIATVADPATAIAASEKADLVTFRDSLERHGIPLDISATDRTLHAHTISTALDTRRFGRKALLISKSGCPFLWKTLPRQRLDAADESKLAKQDDDLAARALGYFLSTTWSPLHVFPQHTRTPKPTTAFDYFKRQEMLGRRFAAANSRRR